MTAPVDLSQCQVFRSRLSVERRKGREKILAMSTYTLSVYHKNDKEKGIKNIRHLLIGIMYQCGMCNIRCS